MAKSWYIVNVRSGRELFLHELFESSGFEVYTPFQTKFQRPVSRKARANRQAPKPYADPLFKGYLFVGTDKWMENALISMAYIIERRTDAYSFMVHRGEAVSFSAHGMERWKNSLSVALSEKKRIVLRGYDSRKDAMKNKTRLYGQEAITLPTFTKGDKVEFMDGGFQGLSAEVTEVGSEEIKVLTKIFGQKREVKVDPYDLRKAG